MTEDHPNAAAYRQAADAFRAGDLARIEALVDPHVVWHVPGNHPRAGDIRGRDALLAWLAGLTEVGFWLTEHDVFANDEHVCALSYMGARGPGIDVQTRTVRIFHFRDGRQAERWFFPEDPVAWDRILRGTSSQVSLTTIGTCQAIEDPSPDGRVLEYRLRRRQRASRIGT